MGLSLRQQRPVYVVGIGLHRYQKPSDTTYVTLGVTAVREALADAGIAWTSVESAYIGNALLGMAPGLNIVRYLGATGLSVTQVENASASGSTAVRQACLEVASGACGVALALGVDKTGMPAMGSMMTGIERLADGAFSPAAGFALMAAEYMNRYGATAEQLAAVSVKNHNNGAKNPYAHFQKERTLEDVMNETPIAGVLTRLHCCPVGEGAAAVIVASEDAIETLGIDAARAIQVTASVSKSERVYEPGQTVTVPLTRETVFRAYEQAGISPSDLDVIELHDAFTIEELLYVEAMGLCGEGEGAAYIADGRAHVGGECAVSPSGGLLSMGHPIGPTGVGQIAEITRQLRHEAGERQQPGAKTALAHMVGVGQVCLVHILQRPA